RVERGRDRADRAADVGRRGGRRPVPDRVHPQDAVPAGEEPHQVRLGQRVAVPVVAEADDVTPLDRGGGRGSGGGPAGGGWGNGHNVLPSGTGGLRGERRPVRGPRPAGVGPRDEFAKQPGHLVRVVVPGGGAGQGGPGAVVRERR